MLRYFISALACAGTLAGFSQKNELSGLVSIESPKGALGSVYSPAPLFQISYSSTTKYKKKWNSLGVTLGYSSMTPIQSLFSYPILSGTDTTKGTATYTVYHSYQLMANVKTGRKISKALDLFWGMDAGINFTTYEYTTHGGGIDENGTERITRYVLAPKLGLNINLSKSFYLLLQARYVFSVGSNDNESSVVNRFTSFGTGITYRF